MQSATVPYKFQNPFYMASGGAGGSHIKTEEYYSNLREGVLAAMKKAETAEQIAGVVRLLDNFDETNATSKEILDSDLGGATLLQQACGECGFTSIVEKLLQKGANPKGTLGSFEGRPLYQACYNKCEETAKLLVTYGADDILEEGDSHMLAIDGRKVAFYPAIKQAIADKKAAARPRTRRARRRSNRSRIRRNRQGTKRRVGRRH